MKAEEKAKEIVEMYLKVLAGGMYDVREEAKQCALICVDEIIKEALQMDEKWHDNEDAPLTSVFNYSYEYWLEVRKEIEKL
jgi:hypothetical protein